MVTPTSPPPGWGLDDIIEELHGPHDVLVLWSWCMYNVREAG